jgi:tetratricopeptide (TPR) repeat protein
MVIKKLILAASIILLLLGPVYGQIDSVPASPGATLTTTPEALAPSNCNMTLRLADQLATMLKRGRDLDAAGSYNTSLLVYEQITDLYDDSPDGWCGRGTELMRLHEFTTALWCLNQLLEISPHSAYALSNKGIAFWELHENDAAVKTFDEAHDSDPTIALVWEIRGNALDALGRYDEAILSYFMAGSLDKTPSADMEKQGESHFKAGEYLVAIEYCDGAIKQDPQDKNAWYHKAESLRMLHRDSEAKDAYSKARELGYNGTMSALEMSTN